MVFKPGFKLVEVSLFDTANGALSAITFVEGPDTIEQFTLRVATLRSKELRSSEIEVRSSLFPEFNAAAHRNEPLFSLVGKEKIDLTIDAQFARPEDTAQQIDNLSGLPPGIYGSIYPSPMNEPKVLFDFYFGEQASPIMGSARRLGDGFAFSATFVAAVMVSGVIGGAVAYQLKGQNKIINDLSEKDKTFTVPTGFKLEISFLGISYDCRGNVDVKGH
jgi:hypothetical protein